MRKFESFFYKISIFLQKTTTCTGLPAEQMFSVNISNIFFRFWESLLWFFFYVLPEAAASCVEKMLKYCLLHCTSICKSSKSVSNWRLFQTEDFNIFVLHGVFFSRYDQLRNSFSDEKNSGKI